jgi:hypothetical protein
MWVAFADDEVTVHRAPSLSLPPPPPPPPRPCCVFLSFNVDAEELLCTPQRRHCLLFAFINRFSLRRWVFLLRPRNRLYLRVCVVVCVCVCTFCTTVREGRVCGGESRKGLVVHAVADRIGGVEVRHTHTPLFPFPCRSMRAVGQNRRWFAPPTRGWLETRKRGRRRSSPPHS